jgi:Hg(II)-responsive transcriptional regulator
MKPLTIGALAREAGVGVETVRFYERRGLLPEPERKASGYRQYAPDDVETLRFIRRAKELGFTLREIQELLSLRFDATATRYDVRKQARAKIEDIERRIADLTRMKGALADLVASCHGDGPAAGCPIITALSDLTTRPRSTAKADK